jgi:tyrosine-protein phosphatase YwqE
MCESGVVPIVAHPERYDACTVDVVRLWRATGAKMQVDATGLAKVGIRGRRARDIVQEGLADVLAADNHGDGRSMRRGVQFLREQASVGSRTVETAIAKLTEDNPRSVVEDRDLVDVPVVRLSESIAGRFRRLIGG